jgi:hypothetical protein
MAAAMTTQARSNGREMLIGAWVSSPDATASGEEDQGLRGCFGEMPRQAGNAGPRQIVITV